MANVHLTGAWILLICGAVGSATMLLLLHLTRMGVLLHEHIRDRPRRRMFLAAVSFFLTFLGARLLVLAILHNIGPFGWVVIGGRHIHHLVWGIVILLVVGFAWLAEVGEETTPTSIFLSRLVSIMYGIGAALTLDEFALWLNLANVYSSPEGRESIDVVLLFGGLLAIAGWGAPFLKALINRPRGED
ncbi:MAG TPA: hypothetical protein VE178_13660 [Silvibacterium sp.]|nr:hypothetical protein [Silvibacterium sp.]